MNVCTSPVICWWCMGYNHKRINCPRLISKQNVVKNEDKVTKVKNQSLGDMPIEVIEIIMIYASVNDLLEMRRTSIKLRECVENITERCTYLNNIQEELARPGTTRFIQLLEQLPEYQNMVTNFARRVFYMKALKLTIATGMGKTGSAYLRFMRKGCESFEAYRRRKGRWAKRSSYKEECDKKWAEVTAEERSELRIEVKF